jgi:hypothetical protein
LFLLTISFSAFSAFSAFVEEAKTTDKKEGKVKSHHCANCEHDKMCKHDIGSDAEKCPHCKEGCKNCRCKEKQENKQEKRQNFNQQNQQ